MIDVLSKWIQQHQNSDKLDETLLTLLEHGLKMCQPAELSFTQRLEFFSYQQNQFQQFPQWPGLFSTLKEKSSHQIKEYSQSIIELCSWIDAHKKELLAVSLPPAQQGGSIRFRNLRGTPCPINFVKAKLELSKMKSGEQLELILDEGTPVENVPRSLKREGHQVLEIKRISPKHFRVLIQKS
jgi:TusA-related sulfurtransferase